MRRTLILLTPLLLAGCIKDSATYYIDDSSNNHVITVRAEQEYFWKDDITLTLVASHMPECLRAFPMSPVAADDVSVELFSNGDDVYTVRSGTEVMQIDTQTCSQLAEPAPAALGQALGAFVLDGGEMNFEKVEAPAAPAAPAASPAAPGG